MAHGSKGSIKVLQKWNSEFTITCGEGVIKLWDQMQTKLYRIHSSLNIQLLHSLLLPLLLSVIKPKGVGGLGKPFPNKGPMTSQGKSSTPSFGNLCSTHWLFIYGKAWCEDYHDPKFKHKSWCFEGEGSYTYTLRVRVILHLAIKPSWGVGIRSLLIYRMDFHECKGALQIHTVGKFLPLTRTK
jgi:hypothetical protein